MKLLTQPRGAPALFAWGCVPRGPLAILKDTMTGKVELPLNLRKNLDLARYYAMSHTDKAHQRYISRYNLRAKEKSFEVGQKVLVLTPDSTSSDIFEMGRSNCH